MFEFILLRPRLPGLLIVLVGLGVLGTALASQYWGGLAPCVLCIYQRYAYVAAILAGLAAVALSGHAVARRWLVALAGLAFLAGAAIAVFHVGVEQHWWRGTAECHAPVFDPEASIAELRKQLLETEFVACDQIPWSLFGISMAGYNALVSLQLAGLSFAAAQAMGRTR